MKRSLKVAVVGAGIAGQGHAFGFRNATMAHDLAALTIELGAIVDSNPTLARSVAERYGFAAAHTDIRSVLDDPSFDVVSVALPNGLHLEVLPQVFAAGKHLFAEKPLGRTADEAHRLADIAAASGVVAQVGFTFRGTPGLCSLAEIVSSGAIGDVHHARASFHSDYALDPEAPMNWRYSLADSGGGALVDLGSHVIDALQFVAGPISRVLGASLVTVIPTRPLTDRGSATATEAERGEVTNDDTALVTVELAGGGLGHIEVSRVAAGVPFSLGVSVFGSQGHVTFDSIRGGEFEVFQIGDDHEWSNGPRRVVLGPRHPHFVDVVPMTVAGVSTGYGEAFLAEIQDFVRAVMTENPTSASFDAAVSVMDIIGAAQAIAADRERQSAGGSSVRKTRKKPREGRVAPDEGGELNDTRLADRGHVAVPHGVGDPATEQGLRQREDGSFLPVLESRVDAVGQVGDLVVGQADRPGDRLMGIGLSAQPGGDGE